MKTRLSKITALAVCIILMLTAFAACNKIDGTNGANGKSAYELAVEKGYTGTLDEWISSLAGASGKDGEDGKSAYELAVDKGYTGTEDEWLESLIGKDGINGTNGVNGKSAYELAVENGFDGTVSEWLLSLVGERGIQNIHIAIDGSVEVTLTDGTKYTVEVTEATCQHPNHEITVISPTCGDKGYTIFKCPDCGYIEHNTYKDPIGHHFYERYCLHCGAEESFGVITTNVEWYADSLNEFTLTTKEELAGLAYLVNIDGKNFSGKTVYLGNDIDLSSLEWEPIGNASKAFAGTFNGRGFAVKNLKISTKTEYVGLFGNASGQLSNFSVEGASVSVTGEGQYVGIAIGYKNGAIIENISVTGAVDASGSTYVGGIVGYFNPAGGHRVYKNLSNSADISGYSYVGGIFGQIYYQAANGSSTTWTFTSENFSNSGKITASGDYAGGLGGYFHINDTSTYSDSYYKFIGSELHNTGDIIGNGNIGGLFGYFYSESEADIKNSSNIANVTAYEFHAGGIAGTLNNAKLTSVTSCGDITATAFIGGFAGEGTVSFDGCSNEGSTVIATGYQTVESNFYAYLGGYIGKGTCYDISNCENTVDVNYTEKGIFVGGFAGYVSPGGGNKTYSNVTNSASVSGPAYVGGLFGEFYYHGSYGSGTTWKITFNNISNSGKVTATGDFAGGIAGHFYINDTSTYSDSYYKFIGDELGNTGNISGNNYVGGWFGSFSSESEAIITDSSNGADANASGYYAGGLAGAMYNASLTAVTSAGDIVGCAFVGGFAGEGTVSFNGCSNSGSTVTATGYHTVEANFYAYLGGYIGNGTCYTISDCENTVSLNYTEKGMFVGGFGGKVSPGGGNRTYSNVTNSASIKGFSHVGGLFGEFYYSGSYSSGTSTVTMSNIYNSGDVVAQSNYAGGILGNLYLNDTHTYSDGYYRFSGTEIHNTGDVSGLNHVGGFFGYFHSEAEALMTNSSNNADVKASEYNAGGIAGSMYNMALNTVTSTGNISALAYAGGLVGEGTVSFTDCSNAGSAVTASGYYTSGTEFYAYLGGYIGKGTCYTISNCENTVSLDYDEKGLFVGGFGGYVSPGGGNRSFSNIKNSADISGYSYVGGLFGSFYYHSSYTGGTTRLIMTEVSNSGNIAAVANFAGGIAGHVHLNDTHTYSDGYYGATINKLTNTGNISGDVNVGGWFGYFYSEASSTLVDGFAAGKVAGNDKTNLQIGEANNITVTEDTSQA